MRISIHVIIVYPGLVVMMHGLLGCTPEQQGEGIVTRPMPEIRPYGPPSSLASGPVEAPADTAAGEAEPSAAEALSSAPNPFNPATELAFEAPAGGGFVSLTIHSLDGRRARRLVHADLAEGRHTAIWRGRDDAGRRLASGVYVACLRSGGEVQVRKVVLVQ